MPPAVKAEAVYTFRGDGSINVTVTARVNEGAPQLPRFGLRLAMPKDFKNLQYIGYGPAETYADFWKLVGSKETPPKSVATDGIVAVQNYVALTNGLAKAGVPFAARLESYRHCKILSSKPETRPWLYENLKKYLKGF